MKILIVGSGGREHAIAWKIAQSPKVTEIFCAPGNAGTANTVKCTNIIASTCEELLDFALKHKINLTFVGSEELLVAGIVDEFIANDLAIFGPHKAAAILEGSKAFSKDFMKKYGVNTAKYEVFSSADKARAYLETCDFPLVLKASGLAAGKGVIIAADKLEALGAIDEIMVQKIFAEAGNEIVIEEFLDGVEASILSITDGKTIIPFISAKDHKKIGENETGLNTGGMGCIAPNPFVTSDIFEKFTQEIMIPTLRGIQSEKLEFSGIIFFGLMITKKGVYCLEYNMRLGDPETQVVLPLLQTDLVDIVENALNKNLENCEVKWANKSACCVVAAASGYPTDYRKGDVIYGVKEAGEQVFMAGVQAKNGAFITAGGRVLNVVAVGNTLLEAQKKAYSALDKIEFNGIYFRKDIGKACLVNT